jgi:hypothetical protein
MRPAHARLVLAALFAATPGAGRLPLAEADRALAL